MEKEDISGFPTAKININNNEYYAIGENEIKKTINNILMGI